MQFNEILSSIRGPDENLVVTVSDDWLQGRATYGGLVAAVGNEAMRKFVPRDRPLRSLQTTFVGPAGPGDWSLRARVLRAGKAVTLAQCEVIEGGQVVAVQTGVYGADRESAVLVKPTAVAPPCGVDEIGEVRYVPEQLPAFVLN